MIVILYQTFIQIRECYLGLTISSVQQTVISSPLRENIEEEQNKDERASKMREDIEEEQDKDEELDEKYNEEQKNEHQDRDEQDLLEKPSTPKPLDIFNSDKEAEKILKA